MTTYRTLLRPAGFATLPSGLDWQYTEVPRGHPNPFGLPVSRHPFGVIKTTRPLTPEEQEVFDIRPVDPAKPVHSIHDYNVYDYFIEELGAAPTDDTLTELPLDSKCGQDCAKAIDAAAVFLGHLDRAGDSAGSSRRHQNVIAACDHVCQVYWRG